MKLLREIRIAIAEDHPVFRQGLRQIIEEDPSAIIVSEADNGRDALANIRELSPDIAVLDIDMPGMTGLEVLKELRHEKSNVKVVFLTVYADEDIFDEGMENGLLGYVLKDSAVSEISDCLVKVSSGDFFISPKMTDILMKRKKKNGDGFQEKLTRTEIQVLKLIANGLTTKEVAELMGISFKTAENHRANISGKLELSGANSLLHFAISNKEKL